MSRSAALRGVVPSLSKLQNSPPEANLWSHLATGLSVGLRPISTDLQPLAAACVPRGLDCRQLFVFRVGLEDEHQAAARWLLTTSWHRALLSARLLDESRSLAGPSIASAEFGNSPLEGCRSHVSESSLFLLDILQVKSSIATVCSP